MTKQKMELRGTLSIGENFCTERIRIHPIASGTWALYLPEIESRNSDVFASLVLFSKNQLWTAYYCSFTDSWEVERSGLLLRMPPEDFEKFFGKYLIKK